jgi:hypothetical protein
VAGGGRRAPGRATSPARLIDALVRVAPRFSPEDRREKLRLLQQLGIAAIGHPAALRRYHEALCFLQAYPDDPQVLAHVDRELDGWERRIGGLSRRARAGLRDSGMAGTEVRYPFGFGMARWLARRDPRGVRVAWSGGSEGERLEETLSLLVTPVEGEAFTEGGPGWRRWLETATRGDVAGVLPLLIDLFERASVEAATRDWLFESLGLMIEWRVPAHELSRTHARLPDSPVGFPARRAVSAPRTRGALRRMTGRPVRLRPAPPVLAERLIEAARVAMATRARELYAFSYPNPRDVLVADMEHGLRVALIGLPPQRRLPLDAYYAFLALKNGVPVSYGAGWYLFGTLEIGFNVFESFRHGGSAAILGQVLRAYRRVFPVRAVVVDRDQVGHDNEEALRSGAFYFYYRVGFRPVDAAARRLARAERARIARHPGYRSPLAVLRQLSRDDLVLTLGPGLAPPRVRAGDLAARVSEHVAVRYEGDRRAAVRAATRRLTAAMGSSGSGLGQGAGRVAFESFALLLGLVHDLELWPRRDLRALAAIIRSKAGPCERVSARLMDLHHRLRDELRLAARRRDL